VRIVLDTNVVLSALLWRGTPQLLEAIRNRSETRLFTSPALLDELAGVLTRSSPTKRLTVIGKTARAVLADYVKAAEAVEPDHVPRVVPNDADDDQLIAAGVTAGADWIVSGDADLLSMGSYQGIPIITAAQAVEQNAR
jgi:putative PIN family toxin of toxin-antitoxin system